MAPLVVGCGLAVSPLPLIQEGSGWGTSLKNDRATRCGTNNKVQDVTAVNLELQHALTVMHYHLNDTPSGANTVLKPAIRGHKVGSDPVPGNPHPFLM